MLAARCRQLPRWPVVARKFSSRSNEAESMAAIQAAILGGLGGGDSQSRGEVFGHVNPAVVSLSGVRDAKRGDLVQFDHCGGVGVVLSLETHVAKVGLLSAVDAGASSLPRFSGVNLLPAAGMAAGPIDLNCVAGAIVDPLGQQPPLSVPPADLKLAAQLVSAAPHTSSFHRQPYARGRDEAMSSSVINTGVAAVDALRPLARGGVLALASPPARGLRSSGLSHASGLAASMARRFVEEPNAPKPRRAVVVCVGQSFNTTPALAAKLGLPTALATETSPQADAMTLMVAPADSPAAMQQLAPHAGLRLAETAMAHGEDVLVVIDGFHKALANALFVLEEASMLDRCRATATNAALARSLTASFMDRAAAFAGGGSITLVVTADSTPSSSPGDVGATDHVPELLRRAVLDTADSSMQLTTTWKPVGEFATAATARATYVSRASMAGRLASPNAAKNAIKDEGRRAFGAGLREPPPDATFGLDWEAMHLHGGGGSGNRMTAASPPAAEGAAVLDLQMGALARLGAQLRRSLAQHWQLQDAESQARTLGFEMEYEDVIQWEVLLGGHRATELLTRCSWHTGDVAYTLATTLCCVSLMRPGTVGLEQTPLQALQYSTEDVAVVAGALRAGQVDADQLTPVLRPNQSPGELAALAQAIVDRILDEARTGQ